MANHTPTKAIFPGTFDPVTLGHIDIIRRAQGLFGQLVVAIGSNPTKRELFTVEQRKAMITDALAAEDIAVTVEAYDDLTVDYARRIGAVAIVRGIRNYTDLQFEFQLALTNRAVADIETVFIMADERYGFTSSTLIKQIAVSGHTEHLRNLLPAASIEQVERKLIEDRASIEALTNDQHKQ